MRSIFLSLIAFIAPLILATAADSTPSVLTLGDLVLKADRIVVAEIGDSAEDGTTSLIVKETIKAPEMDALFEKRARAEALLAAETAPAGSQPAPAKSLLPEKLTVKALMKLPKAGTTALFFLWEPLEKRTDEKKPILAYAANSPQNVYDSDLAPQARAALSWPRKYAETYLRDWDRQRAAVLRARAQEDTIKQMKGGESQVGMTVKASRPAVSIRGDNTFNITAILTNALGRDQTVYNGPAGCFGVRIRPAQGAAADAIILRPNIDDLGGGADASVLEIQDDTDFVELKTNEQLSRELRFDATKHNALKTLSGDYMISVFYNNVRDGRKTESAGRVWTGTLMSEELPIRFGK